MFGIYEFSDNDNLFNDFRATEKNFIELGIYAMVSLKEKNY